MDTSEIPAGKYCYYVVKIKSGETLSRDAEKFGFELREFPYRGEYKEVLCPYWQKTEYGTVRCDFLKREFYDAWDVREHDKILAHFETANMPAHIEHSDDITDEIKICDINKDEYDDNTCNT